MVRSSALQDVTEAAVGDSAQGVGGAGLSETQEPELARVDGGHFSRGSSRDKGAQVLTSMLQ